MDWDFTARVKRDAAIEVAAGASEELNDESAAQKPLFPAEIHGEEVDGEEIVKGMHAKKKRQMSQLMTHEAEFQ